MLQYAPYASCWHALLLWPHIDILNAVFYENSIYRILNNGKTAKPIYLFEYAARSEDLGLHESVTFSIVNYVSGTGNQR
jgi:hypothetical protein